MSQQGQFDDTAVGVIVQPVAGITAAALRLYLPPALRSRADAFLGEVVGLVELFVTMGDDEPATAAQLRDTLDSVGAAAHRMRNALQPLAGCSQAFQALECYFDPRVTQGRTVPLPQLLQRLYDDLDALRAGCERRVSSISPTRAKAKWAERWLVQQIAEAYRKHFGERPPQRSWFADDLLSYIGKTTGHEIGHKVVGEVVSALE